jgi:hypothetical protein
MSHCRPSHILRTLILVIFLAASPLLAQLSLPPTGSISGTVGENKGHPAPALITATAPGVVKHAVSLANGVFTVKNLPAGTYTLCAQVPGTYYAPNDDPFVDNCLWADSTNPRVTLTTGQAITGITITLQRGRRYQITVKDPDNLLHIPIGKHPAATDMQLNITGPTGATRSIPIVRMEAGRRFHEIVIPYNAQHQFQAQSGNYQLNDDNGHDQSSDPPKAVQVAPGAAASVSTITVKAKGGK